MQILEKSLSVAPRPDKRKPRWCNPRLSKYMPKSYAIIMVQLLNTNHAKINTSYRKLIRWLYCALAQQAIQNRNSVLFSWSYYPRICLEWTLSLTDSCKLVDAASRAGQMFDSHVTDKKMVQAPHIRVTKGAKTRWKNCTFSCKDNQ